MILKRYDVLLPLPYDDLFTYSCNRVLEPGSIVEVPFGRCVLNGVVWQETDHDYRPNFSIKAIQHVWELPPLSEPTRQLVDWTARYYMVPRGHCLKMSLSGLPEKAYNPRKKYGNFSVLKDRPRDFPLTAEQLAAAEHIQQAIQSQTFEPFVLDGVTGSGKTEVYYEALRAAIRIGRQVLILLPEITLTQQWLDRFQKRFGVLPARWHSSLKKTERLHTWQQIIKGHASVVVGARSALFLPYSSLGLIVVDEEHDASYKQEEGIRYHARDLAVVRARLEQCPVVLASATPSVETYHNVQSGKYKALVLGSRFGSAAHPKAHIIDLRHKTEGVRGGQYISNSLISAIEATIQRNEQGIIFLNRRGFAPLTLCTDCGHKVTCSNCSAHLVHHRSHLKKAMLQCHHCGLSTNAYADCSDCGGVGTLREWGVGIDRLTDELRNYCPDARIMTVSSDHITHADHLENLYKALLNHQVDIVVGTQLMAKGHDFSNVTLVGIIDADAGLMSQDVRAAETTYQLLHQVAGRCGRGHKPGSVYIQTFSPDHPVIQALSTFDRDAFLTLELYNRETAQLPPFARQVGIIITGKNEEQVQLFCSRMYQQRPNTHDMTLLGPAPAPLVKLRGQYRYRFLVQSPKQVLIQPFLHEWLQRISIPNSIKLGIDIDPISLF